MRVEITPIYEVNTDAGGNKIAGTAKLISIRKRLYRPDERLHSEYFLDWATGEWHPSMEPEWEIDISPEMRVRVGWKNAGPACALPIEEANDARTT